MILLSASISASESGNMTIQREMANQIPTIYGDVRCQVGSTAPAFGLPYSDPMLRLTFDSWTPYWQSGAPSGMASGIVRPVAEPRNEVSFVYRQGLTRTGWLNTEAGLTGAKNRTVGDVTMGDPWTGISVVLASSRYSGVSLGLGTFYPIGGSEDWLMSHGALTPYLNLRGTIGLGFFVLNANGQAEWNMGTGKNAIRDAPDLGKVENDYRSFKSSASLTYRVCRGFRFGVEQQFDRREWTLDRQIIGTMHVEDAATRALIEFTPLSGLRVELSAGRDWLANPKADANVYGKPERGVIGSSLTYIF